MLILTGTYPYTPEFTDEDIEEYPNCFLCGEICDENFSEIDGECVCTECMTSEDNIYNYGSISNLIKSIKNESIN